MDETTLTQRKNDAQVQFDSLTGQINDLNKQVQGLLEERLRVEGEYRLVTSLMDNLKPKKAEK